jgi:putative NIF3 family GTP cyclohydrolase 1 type 2
MVRALGWERFQDPVNQFLFTVPQMTLKDLAADIRKRMAIRVVRVVGDPGMKVTRIALSPGAALFAAEARLLEMPDVEVLVLGETREWETVEYVSDAITAGKRKALIILNHIPSEQAGMEECHRWLKTEDVRQRGSHRARSCPGPLLGRGRAMTDPPCGAHTMDSRRLPTLAGFETC